MNRYLYVGVFAMSLILSGGVFAEHNNGNGSEKCESVPCGKPGKPGKGGNSTVDVVVSTNTHSFQDQFQSSHNSAVNGGNNNEFTSVTEAPDLSRVPASPASVYVDMCSSGASVSGPGYGATLGTGDAFCKKLALAAAFERSGDVTTAKELLQEARSDLNRRNFVRRFFDWIPVVGGLF